MQRYLTGLVLMAYIVVRYSPLYYGLLLIIIIIIMLQPLAEMESARVYIVCMVVVCRRVVLSACKPRKSRGKATLFCYLSYNYTYITT